MSITAGTKPRGRPPTGKGVQIGVRLQPDQLAAIDAWIAEQPVKGLTRPEAIRRLLATALGTDQELIR